jgi:hypothetical protein
MGRRSIFAATTAGKHFCPPLALFNTPQLKAVAQEVEDTMVKIMKAAASG